MTNEESTLEVHDLGEDGDDWIVTGTTKDMLDEVILIAVAKAILDSRGIEEGAIENIQALPTHAVLTFRPDWGWEPIDPTQTDDECYLVHGDKVSESADKFAATRVFL